jgi:hypothetical protein
MKVAICTPCFNGQCSVNFTLSLMQTFNLLTKNYIDCRFITISNRFTLPARNNLVKAYLEKEKDCTHLFFIDSDISWNPEELLNMLKKVQSDEEKYKVTCAIYPNKSYLWERGVKDEKDKTTIDITKVLECAFIELPEDKKVIDETTKLQTVKHAGTGFMLIKRDVFENIEDMCETYIEDGEEIREYFKCRVVENDYLTEDYYFCHMCGEKDINIWFDEEVKLSHEGNHVFSTRLYY